MISGIYFLQIRNLFFYKDIRSIFSRYSEYISGIDPLTSVEFDEYLLWTNTNLATLREWFHNLEMGNQHEHNYNKENELSLIDDVTTSMPELQLVKSIITWKKIFH